MASHNPFFKIRGRLFLFLALFTIGFYSCQDEEEHVPSPSQKASYFHNNPLPVNPDTLRILAIGNSYSWDGTAYISEILDSTNINRSCYCVYLLTKGNTDLQYWQDELTSDSLHFLYRIAGDLIMPHIRATVPELLAQDWDIIVMQQLSKYATDYSTYNPSLRALIDEIHLQCTNPQVALAWQLIHAYGKNSSNNKGLIGNDRWQEIANATKTMIQNDGIDIIIPTGTAIQRARNSSLENDNDLTRDNTHLCYGVGRYIAACTWIETLFGPTYNISIVGNTANHALSEKEIDDGEQGFILGSSIAVTDENRAMCQQCAHEACLNPYDISTATSIHDIR